MNFLQFFLQIYNFFTIIIEELSSEALILLNKYGGIEDF